ncbi:O-succinylbenzoic acid--CoA ligase [Kocuria sp. CNJ-770]|uniref:AMP-binding protein n=1 Tax=Kocuria sp. CNJ-770 TaxID=1904964 RepID=UPI00095EF478|nr:AMP-binding protein [Kocuria sp. CNJ-770]OLT06635.1 O-succinylbenzoic acid--CoA ligase [Kocuria sp. CNJ-770]
MAELIVPDDAVVLDGPVAGDPLRLLSPLTRVLGRAGPAVVVRTSGSTGRAKRTVLTRDALAASSMATAVRTGAVGQWLLALPVHYVAGLQVLVRSLYAGTDPVVLDPAARFTPEAFAEAAARLEDPVRFTSLVPTQLQRILEPESGVRNGDAVSALKSFSAVLLGGSAASPRLLAAAREADLRVISTYGMSETCGGCVYDGVALDGVSVHVEQDGGRPGTPSAPGPGRIWLGGALVAAGYAGDPEQTARHFHEAAGTRWYRTDDLGELSPDGVLSVHGRVDDVLNTGGVKVSAGRVTAVLDRHPAVRQALVLGVPDPEWGQAVGAAVVAAAGTDRARLRAELAEAVRAEHGSAAVPRRWAWPQELPMLPTGKPDRAAVARLLG